LCALRVVPVEQQQAQQAQQQQQQDAQQQLLPADHPQQLCPRDTTLVHDRAAGGYQG
jgi:hypothetical protein